MTISKTNKILGGLWGAVVGDALGLPVQFLSRDEVRRKNVTGMTGHGTFNLPAGSWSDDSSLMLCTVESLLSGFDTRDMGRLFMSWRYEGYWTPWGQAYDIGNTTDAAIARMKQGKEPEKAGGTDEQSNGNGSLMRILPIALYFAQNPEEELLGAAHRVSCLTHGNPRAQMACGFYCLMAARLVKGAGPQEAYDRAIEKAKEVYGKKPFSSELSHFQRIFDGHIGTVPRTAIQSSGYVIDTLEASISCLLTTGFYSEAVLTAVNPGEDTDTTATVTGGLAGIYYGLGAIPEEWIKVIVRFEDIDGIFKRFERTIAERVRRLNICNKAKLWPVIFKKLYFHDIM